MIPTASVLRAALALTALIAWGAPAGAAAVTANASDLILGFRATSGTGAQFNLEVDLGPMSQFYSAAPGTEINLSGPNGLALADLAATFGQSWSTRSDLFFGLIAGTGRGDGTSDGHAPLKTVWASKPEQLAGTQSSPWLRQSSQAQGFASADIETLYSGAGGSFTGQLATAHSAVSAVVNFDGTVQSTGSWTSEDLKAPTSGFSIFNPTIDIAASSIGTAGSLLDGTSYAVLDLYEVKPNDSGTSMSSVLIGAFGLNANGNLVFDTNPAVFTAPEPGALSLLGCGVWLAFGGRRRPARKSSHRP
jgi:hypothetical protein